jgi:hypothetical protein
MQLELNRDMFTEKTTIGRLWINGMDFCETLEDRDRNLESGGQKIKGETCIPRGVYKVVIDYSNRYKCSMPHVLDVPQFTGIRIHPGNTQADTEGCILLGEVRGVDFIGDSRSAFARFMKELYLATDNGEEIDLIIT